MLSCLLSSEFLCLFLLPRHIKLKTKYLYLSPALLKALAWAVASASRKRTIFFRIWPVRDPDLGLHPSQPFPPPMHLLYYPDELPRPSLACPPQGDISIHMVCYGEMTTAEVATQNKEIRHTRMRLRTPRTVRRAPGGRVQITRGGERTSQERRNTRMGDTTLAQQKREEGASRTRERERERGG